METVELSQPDKSKRTPISFHFAPYDFENKNHVIEKADTSGKKRKYIYGVASGIKTDAHDERMTAECIKSFMEQSNAGQILLYPDIHGIRASEDFGILIKAEVKENGDWFTEFRLYDEDDDVDNESVEKANKVWKQLNGLPPYKKPMQKGMSIEGYIPENGILSAEKDQNGNLKNRVINKVELDGVVLVPRPAYKDSIAHSIYKALGELPPWKREKLQKSIQSSLRQNIQNQELEHSYHRDKWNINDSFECEIEKIMIKKDLDKRQQLEILFDEYKNIMIELLLKSEGVFTSEEPAEIEINAYSSKPISKASKLDVYKSILFELKKLKTLGGHLHEK